MRALGRLKRKFSVRNKACRARVMRCVRFKVAALRAARDFAAFFMYISQYIELANLKCLHELGVVLTCAILV